MFNRSLTMRIDAVTESILKGLVKDLNFSKAEVIRKSLRLLKELTVLKNKYGEISLITQKDEKVIILLS